MMIKIPKRLFSVNYMLLLLFLVISAISNAQTKGLIVNGGSLVISPSGAGPYIIVKNDLQAPAINGNFTIQTGGGSDGVIIPTGIGGTIYVEADWYNKCNNNGFSTDGVTVELNGSNAQNIGPASGSGGYATKFYNLNLGGTGTKTMLVNATVGGISTLTGELHLTSRVLDLNSNTLTISNPASTGITRSSGYILSETNSSNNPSIINWLMNTTTGAHVFPFGTASADYIPFTFNKLGASAANISVSTRPTVAANTPTTTGSNVGNVSTMSPDPVKYVIDRWWEITSTLNPLTGGANVIFSYAGAENTMDGTVNTGTIACQHWSGTTWDTKQGTGTGVTSGIGTCTANGLTKFSPYVLVADNFPLPVELLNYTANCDGNNVVLKWSTTSERSSSNYVIEKSCNGGAYEEVTSVQSKGLAKSVSNYEYVDGNTVSGNCYYRLRQIDLDGNAKILSIAPSNCGPKDFEIVNLLNRNNDQIQLSYRIETEETFYFSLYNALGQQLITLPYQSTKGLNEVSFDISNFSYGVYFLVMKNNTHAFTRKIIISK
jgi:hypothetical protein